ncbi:MAG TPA: transcriptional regulator [Lutibacter sp.]|nr:transcriptional regulator [Lutibacter sp.]
MTQINYIICAYIYKTWVEPYKSQRSFAVDHNIEESIVRKIKNTARKKDGSDYSIPVKTLLKICESRNLKLSDFFKLLEL